ncbi:MAG: hypothetical protein WBD99_06135 [Thermodesulfobacteriota bacterium]
MNKLFLVIMALIASVLFLPLTTNISVNASEEEDINVLILTANTPENHMRIVEYYQKQAAKMEKMAELHESMGAAYKKRSKPWPSMAKGCEKLRQDDTDAANEYKALAREHEKMAQEMQQK